MTLGHLRNGIVADHLQFVEAAVLSQHQCFHRLVNGHILSPSSISSIC